MNNKTNNFLEKYIFDKKSKKKLNNWYILDFRSDPDPYQNETDPKHWMKCILYTVQYKNNINIQCKNSKCRLCSVQYKQYIMYHCTV